MVFGQTGALIVAEAKKKPVSGGGGGGARAVREDDAPGKIDFASLWPVPALILAVGLFVAGLVVAVSSRPKPDPGVPLVEAERLVEAQEYERAIEYLNSDARALVDSAYANDEHRARFHLARARAFSGAQMKLGISREENHRTVVEDYAAVERLGKEQGGGLGAPDVERLVESLVELGEVEAAWERVKKLGNEEGGGARKLRLTKRIVEHNLASQNRRDAMTLNLLAELSNSPDLPVDERGWVLARQGEMLMALGKNEEAVSKLLREIQRLRDVPGEMLGELYVLLGKAYYEAGQRATAARQLEVADTVLDSGSMKRADAGVLLGLILQAAGQLEGAKEKFSAVVQEYAMSSAYPAALLGEAECEAAMGNHDLAVPKFAEVVELVQRQTSAEKGAGAHDGGPHGGSAHALARPGFHFGREMVLRSLLERHRERADGGEPAMALRYAQLAESMYTEAETPADVLEALGRTHRRLGDELIEASRAGKGEDFTVRDLDPATRAEVRQHYVGAGEYYRRHSQALAATDSAGSAASLWISADSFDLSGDLEEARRGFAAYGDGAADEDPKKMESRFRLAKIFQATGEYSAASSLYRGLVEAKAGEVSDRSVVPLAQSLAALGDEQSRKDAESQLLGVVDGGVLSPEAMGYRDALIELCGLYYVSGRYAMAIPRLEQVLERYPGDARVDSTRYRLADSYRLEARAIDATLAQALPQQERDALVEKRSAHLRAAVGLYEQTRVALEAKEASKLSQLERLQLRNSTFSIGDCLYDLGMFDEAIASFDAARLRYADDPASLVAMVQIVAAYVQQGKWAQARTANERARQQLTRFPDEVWSRPDLPMEKRHWERWLDARTALEQPGPAAQAGANGVDGNP